MSLYEHVFIARQDISGAQVDSIVDAMAAVISEGGGEVKKREYWGLRNLTYRIKKNRKGHYVLLNIDAPSAALHEMERQERLHEDILRYMTIRVDALDEEPSIIMKHRGSRDDRDRGPRGRGRDDDRRPPREAREAREGDKPAAAAAPAAEANAEGGETKSEGETA